MNDSVLHLPSSDEHMAALVSRWIASRGAQGVVCNDAYELCVHLLQAPDAPATHVLIGADALLADEFSIFACVASAWPQSRAIAYGKWAAAAPADVQSSITAFDSPAALAECLGVSVNTEHGALRAASAPPRMPAGSKLTAQDCEGNDASVHDAGSPTASPSTSADARP